MELGNASTSLLFKVTALQLLNTGRFHQYSDDHDSFCPNLEQRFSWVQNMGVLHHATQVLLGSLGWDLLG
eukprot:1158192-Pelagomonas_calceolata.AAC.2